MRGYCDFKQASEIKMGTRKVSTFKEIESYNDFGASIPWHPAACSAVRIRRLLVRNDHAHRMYCQIRRNELLLLLLNFCFDSHFRRCSRELVIVLIDMPIVLTSGLFSLEPSNNDLVI